jgi:hypothetical protein
VQGVIGKRGDGTRAGRRLVAGLDKNVWRSAALVVAAFVVIVPGAGARTISGKSSMIPKAAGAGPTYPAEPPVPTAVVPISQVSNGCGGGSSVILKFQNFLGNTSVYHDSNINPASEKFEVTFVKACNLHDAGYSGAEVYDAIHSGYVDFRTWTKAQVDEKFLADMRILCEQQIPTSATVALENCKGTGGNFSVGAESRYKFLTEHSCVSPLSCGGVISAFNYNTRIDLTGPWQNQADRVSPAWHITQTGRLVTADWRGGAGHSGLVGHFVGTDVTLDHSDVVKGTMSVREGALRVGGVMKFTIESQDYTRPGTFEMTYKQENGPSNGPSPITMVAVR